MTEVKSSNLDLLTRQMAGSGKKEAKTVVGFSGFKSMLKSKNQKKDGDNTETGNDTKTAAAETAASILAADMPEVQSHADMSQVIGQEMIRGLPDENINVNEVRMPISDDSGKVQTMNQLQSLNQLRFQQLTEKSDGQKLEDGRTGALPEVMESMPETEPAKEQIMPETGKQKGFSAMMSVNESVLHQDKAGETEKENEDSVAADPLLLKGSLSAQSMAEDGAVLTIQSGETEEKQINSKEEEKKPDESLSVFQEKSYSPNQTLSIHAKDDTVTYAAVNAEDADELEAKLAEEILKQIDSGNRELEVQLEPQNLGKIRIKVSYEENQVSVSVLCTESKTLKLLSQSAGDLGTILETNLERPIQILVDKQETDYLNDQQEQGNRQGQQGQQQNGRQEENREDFIQKLRLGIFEAEDTENT